MLNEISQAQGDQYYTFTSCNRTLVKIYTYVCFSMHVFVGQQAGRGTMGREKEI